MKDNEGEGRYLAPDPRALWRRIEELLKLTPESTEQQRRFRRHKLAEDSGVSEKTLTRWQNGENKPTRDKVRAVAKALGVTPEALVEGLPLWRESDPGPVSTSEPPTPVSEELSSRPPNPYDFTKPAEGPLFVGRTSLMASLMTALGETRSVSLVGDRGLGKSSVLLTWGRRAREVGYDVFPLSGEQMSLTAQAFVEKITKELPPPDNADATAEVLRAWLRRRRSASPPLVLADKFDRLALNVDNRFFQRLRGFVDEGAIVLGTATALDLAELCPKGQTSPFDNVLETHRIGLLEPREADALVALQPDLFDDEDRALIRRWSGCHPYYIKLLAQHLIRARRDGWTRDAAVEACYAEAYPWLLRWWDHLKQSEQQALVGIAWAKQPPPKPMNSLQRRGLLDSAGAPFGMFLKRWLLELTC